MPITRRIFGPSKIYIHLLEKGSKRSFFSMLILIPFKSRLHHQFKDASRELLKISECHSTTAPKTNIFTFTKLNKIGTTQLQLA